MQEEARKLLNDADFESRNEEHECFGCETKVTDIKRCSGCKLAKYCSQVSFFNFCKEELIFKLRKNY